MMYKTPTFAEPQQYNRPFSWGHVSANTNKYGKWHVATPQWMKKKKSCNKNAIKNTDMIETFIWMQYI